MSINNSAHNRGWFKSSFSQGSDECVEVWMSHGRVAIRDSKNPSGPVLPSVTEWRFLIVAVKRGDFTES